MAGLFRSLAAMVALLGVCCAALAAPRADVGGPTEAVSVAVAGEEVVAQLVNREGAERRPRPGYISPYAAGVYAGAAEAGAIIGADAVDRALDEPPPADPACNFPSEQIGTMSAGIPPCNFCDNPPCN